MCASQPGPKVSSQRRHFLQLIATVAVAALILRLVKPDWLRQIFLVRHDDALKTALTLLLTLAASVAVHELGHLIPSLAFGFRVSRVVFGPVSFSLQRGKWRLQYSRNWFAASVSALPQSDTGWRSCMVVVVAGGPLLTLCLFLYSAQCLAAIGPFTPWSEIFSALAQLNFFLFVLGLVPNSANAPIRNDARLFLALLQNGDQARQIRLYHAATRLQVAGVRPKAFPAQLMAQLAHAKGNDDLRLFSALTVFLWAWDSGNLAAASAFSQYCEDLMQDRPLRLSDAVLLEIACFDLLNRNLPVTAAQKLRAAKVNTLVPWLQHRAAVALLIAERSYSDALVRIQSARAYLSAEIPYFHFELALLDALEGHAILQSSQIVSTRQAA